MLRWRQVEKIHSKGIVVASSEAQEWLLPWWFENYSKHNAFPITFVDFGLTEKGKAFCRQRGELVEIPSFNFLGERQKTDKEKGDFWQSVYGSDKWWQKRAFWHKKPIALLQTPYEKTLWLDIDCEIHSSLDSVFEMMENTEDLLLCPEPKEVQEMDREKGVIFADEVLFNSGVIGFMKDSPLILEWAEKTLVEHGEYFGDQNLLSRLIYEKKWPIKLLDALYNWRQISQGNHPDVKITHWVGESGKFFISLKQMNVIS